MKTETETTEIADSTIAETQVGDDTAVAKAEPGDTTVYTREKQMVDFERANAARAREEAQAAQEALEEVSTELEQVKTELIGLKATHDAEQKKLQVQQQKLEDMDPEVVDAKVIANIRRLEQLQREQEANFQKEKAELLAQVKVLSEKAQTYEQKEQDRLALEENRQAREAVIGRVESTLKKIGVSAPEMYRVEAMKLADDMVDKGEVRQPKKGEFFYAVDLLEDCYLKVKAKSEKTKSKTVSVDTGKSGVGTPAKKSGIKPGRLDAVYDQMVQDDSWRQD